MKGSLVEAAWRPAGLEHLRLVGSGPPKLLGFLRCFPSLTLMGGMLWVCGMEGCEEARLLLGSGPAPSVQTSGSSTQRCSCLCSRFPLPHPT